MTQASEVKFSDYTLDKYAVSYAFLTPSWYPLQSTLISQYCSFSDCLRLWFFGVFFKDKVNVMVVSDKIIIGNEANQRHGLHLQTFRGRVQVHVIVHVFVERRGSP